MTEASSSIRRTLHFFLLSQASKLVELDFVSLKTVFRAGTLG